MKLLYTFYIFLIASTLSWGQEDSVLIQFKVIDSYSEFPVSDIDIEVMIGFKMLNFSFGSIAEKETFNIKLPRTNKNEYCLKVKNKKYISKNYCISDSSIIKMNTISLRPKNKSFNYDSLDSTIIGKRVNKIVNELNLDTDDYTLVFEPHGICRGINFELGDGSNVFLFIERTVLLKKHQDKILRKKIIGVLKEFSIEKRVFIGEGAPYTYSN